MATYKVIQDIEAEDHILWRLSLRQFIFAIIAIFCIYMSYLLISKQLAYLTPIFILPGLFTGFFAIPFGRDQPTEIWALAKIRFLFKPRRRIWDQSGVKELVTVTVPKHIEEHLTNGLSDTEVKSRLSALATTIDSRGWAIKNVNVNLYSQASAAAVPTSSDRLIDINSMPQEVPNYDVQAADDILDEHSNPIAQQFDQMINASTQARREHLISLVQPHPTQTPSSTATMQNGSQTPADYWFLNQPATQPKLAKDQSIFSTPSVVLPGVDNQRVSASAAIPTADEQALVERLKTEQQKSELEYSHLKTIQPLDRQVHGTPPAPVAPVVPTAAAQRLAYNDDLSVATIANEAKKAANQPKHLGDDEVIISLH